MRLYGYLDVAICLFLVLKLGLAMGVRLRTRKMWEASLTTHHHHRPMPDWFGLGKIQEAVMVIRWLIFEDHKSNHVITMGFIAIIGLQPPQSFNAFISYTICQCPYRWYWVSLSYWIAKYCNKKSWICEIAEGRDWKWGRYAMNMREWGGRDEDLMVEWEREMVFI